MKKDKPLMMDEKLTGFTLVMLSCIFSLLNCCYVDVRYTIKDSKIRKRIREDIRVVLARLRNMMVVYKRKGLVKAYNRNKKHGLNWPYKIWG